MARNGFTYIELVITVAIIAILAAVIMPLSQISSKRVKEAELRQSLRMIRTAIDDYKRAWDEGKIKKSVGESGYPPDLNILVEGIDDASSAQSGRKIFLLRRIPRDPISKVKDTAPEETWGLRSYQSPPDDPQEGDDVFDIYSKSEEQALDGTYYKDW
ncbi:MAG TPA: general secretion pathway protein GspG [Deltaproteobacteria bacterium]|nr:MAG: general secretion pathway protein GspG [Deltaproteobacteria bacterium GWA2_55_82]OGQ64403.1 MAG: general secretion pathway protein GspG [Deltaproteobacteria bacterium RIFCSPLOWO2_02_FULL_55_12]OIJ72783.1 MAG: general secretion pathway protein GspG [Deltaproteobacteria bacterium GWC2_55_46]HBG46369.1 general secretion pathway protein GspG [Deltaproteobacteria bacterium]HCY11556.1 general secretion pathway protein GspG [Deltaproteobacteria bacterium]